MINKVKLFRLAIFFTMYLATFEKIIEAAANSMAPTAVLPLKIFVQGLMYLPPVLLCWYGKATYRLLLAVLITIHMFIFLFWLDPIMWIPTIAMYKAVFLPLFFIPILHYLVEKDPYFDASMIRITLIIAFMFAAVSLVEVGSWFLFPNPIADWLRTIGDRKSDAWYAESLFNRYSAGALFSSVALYAFLNRRNRLFYFFTFAAFLSMAKTRIVIFIIIIISYMFSRLSAKIMFRIAGGGIFLVIGLWYLIPKDMNPISQVLSQLEFGYSDGAIYFTSAGTQRIAALFLSNMETIVKESLWPHGMFDYTGLSPNELTQNQFEILQGYPDSETALLQFLYGYGAFTMICYFIILYAPLATFRNGWVFKNHYKTMLLFSIAALLHYFDLNFLALYIFVMYVSVKASVSAPLTPS